MILAVSRKSSIRCPFSPRLPNLWAPRPHPCLDDNSLDLSRLLFSLLDSHNAQCCDGSSGRMGRIPSRSAISAWR